MKFSKREYLESLENAKFRQKFFEQNKSEEKRFLNMEFNSFKERCEYFNKIVSDIRNNKMSEREIVAFIWVLISEHGDNKELKKFFYEAETFVDEGYDQDLDPDFEYTSLYNWFLSCFEKDEVLYKKIYSLVKKEIDKIV